MPDERLSVQMNDEQGLSQHVQRLIESLDELWQQHYQPSSDQLQRIIEFVVHFPEPYRMMAMTKIAEYLVNALSLHYLDLMTIFEQKAEEEGIDQEEREGTYRDVMADLYPSMMHLSGDIAVRSLDDLITLNNITFGLYKLSNVKTAERAQRWMYRLPKVYYDQLSQKQLIAGHKNQVTVSIHAEITSSVTEQPQFTVTGQATLTWHWPEPAITHSVGAGAIDSKITDPPTAIAA